MVLDTGSSGRLPTYRYPVLVTAKIMNIVLNPLKRQDLVLKAHVSAYDSVTRIQKPWWNKKFNLYIQMRSSILAFAQNVIYLMLPVDNSW